LSPRGDSTYGHNGLDLLKFKYLSTAFHGRFGSNSDLGRRPT
jgi:hypothetical protein